MKYTFKKLPNSIREVEVIFDHQEFLNYWQVVYDKEISNVHLKGFRPGAAPKELADKSLDKDKIFHEAATEAIREALKNITQENSWDIIDQPRIEILESPAGLKFKASLTLFPEIILGNYKKIAKLVFAEKKDIKVEESEVDKAAEWVLESRAQLIRVNREAQKGDVVDIIFRGQHDRFILGKGNLKEDLEDKIVSHKEGDKFEEVELRGVYERKIPELTDDFVKGLGNFQKVDDFKNSVKKGLLKEKEEREIERKRLKIIEEIIKSSKIDIPQILVDKTLGNMERDYQESLKYLKKPLDIIGDDLRKKLKPEAEKKVAASLVFHQIVKEKNLEPSEKEVNEEANKFLKSLPQSDVSRIDPHKIYDYSYDVVKNKKVFEFLESTN